MDITEIQDELLRLEYPNLLPDHDPDIERYYYLRSIGQSRDAMEIYQNRLIIRYPDNDFRTWLLRCYRSHDPAFRGLLAQGYRILGARSLDRIKQMILLIAEKTESLNEKDVYSTIRTAEDILQFLSPERYEAVAGMERFLRYATVLDLKVKFITKATELVRAYLTDTLLIVEKERRRRSEARRRAEEENRQRLVKADWDSYYFQKKYGVHAPFIDLSTVVFSPSDLSRIEIPSYSRIEDQILGYCIKYWNAANDPAFERILFLYSRKYGKKNYDVYMTIRRGQMAERRDDEILASIMSVLVTGYYYSIQGDMYLQRNWNIIKHALASQGQQKALSPSSKQPAQEKPAVKQIVSKPEPKQIEAKPKPKVKPKQKQKPKQKAAKPKLQIEPKSKPGPKSTIAAKKQKTTSKPVVKTREKQKAVSLEKLRARIIPRRKSKTASKIAPKPTTRKKPAAVVARPAGKSPESVMPGKPVKVPYKLKPAEQTKTTIISSPLPKPVTPKTALVKPPAIKPVTLKPETAIPVIAKPVSPKPVITEPVVAVPVTLPPVQSAGYKPAPFTPASPPKPVPKIKVFNNKTLEKAKGSVSDRLRILSGRSYDVYEDRFLAKARSSIRKVLGTGKGLFFSLPEEAEDLVYNYLRDHYSDPYMDWEGSVDREKLLTMGFDLPSINPVIDECYRIL